MYCSLRQFATVPPGLPGGAFAADDAIRLLRWMARPLAIGLVISLMVLGLLFALQQSQPLLTNPNLLAPQLTIEPQERNERERALRADVDAYLAGLEATESVGETIELP